MKGQDSNPPCTRVRAAFPLWRNVWEASPELVPSGPGIHHLVTNMGFYWIEQTESGLLPKLQGETLFGLPVSGGLLPVLELLL